MIKGQPWSGRHLGGPANLIQRKALARLQDYSVQEDDAVNGLRHLLHQQLRTPRSGLQGPCPQATCDLILILFPVKQQGLHTSCGCSLPWCSHACWRLLASSNSECGRLLVAQYGSIVQECQGRLTCAHTPARLCATSVTLVRPFARITCSGRPAESVPPTCRKHVQGCANNRVHRRRNQCHSPCIKHQQCSVTRCTDVTFLAQAKPAHLQVRVDVHLRRDDLAEQGAAHIADALAAMAGQRGVEHPEPRALQEALDALRRPLQRLRVAARPRRLVSALCPMQQAGTHTKQ